MSFVYVAISSAVGIYGAYQTNEQGKATAKGIESQAKADKDAAERQMQLDSAEESQVASAQRKENRRLRAAQEAAYAGSGVLMEGSAADVLVKQREVQEANVQNVFVSGGNQRAQDKWKSDEDYKSSIYLAKSTKYAAKQKATMQLIQTAASAGVGIAGASSGAAATGGSTFGASSMGSLPSSSIGQVTATNSFNFGQAARTTTSSFKPLI